MARKNVRSTSRQIEMLVDYMSTHTDFANGQWRSHDEEWVRAQKLLQEYGPSKTVEQWRTTWRDLKKKARADGARASAARVAGNHDIIPTLSETSLKILNIIGIESAYGMAAQREIIVAQPPPVTSPPPATPPPRAPLPPPASSPPPATPPPPATSLPPATSPPLATSPSPAIPPDTTQFLADISNKNRSLRESNALMERKLRRRHLESLRKARMEKHRHLGPFLNFLPINKI